MDPLSATASVISIFQLSSDIVKYIIGAAGATKERRLLREEIIACESILLQLQDHADDAVGGTKWWGTIKALEGPNAPLFRLGAALDAFKAKLEPKKGLENALLALKWPFGEKEVNKLISTIQREKSLLQLALTGDCSELASEIKESSIKNGKLLAEFIQIMKDKSTEDEIQFAKLTSVLANIQACQDGMRDNVGKLRELRVNLEQQAILDWITPIDYAPQQSDFINRRQAGTGRWLLGSPEFQEWLKIRKQILFCQGIPGAGKTILTSIAVDNLLTRFQNDPGIGIAYVYCSFQRQDEQKAEDLLASLLKQLAQGRPSLTDSVKFLYDIHKDRRTRPSLDEISRALLFVATTYSRLFIVVDAIDECQATGGCRARLLSELFNLQSKCGASVFATSRFIPEIMEKFKGSILLEILASEQDVRRYVEGHMLHLPSFVRRNADLQEEVKTQIVQSVKGMFLLAQLHLDSLVGKRSPKSIQNALAKLPTGSEAYDHAYNDAMERIERQVSDQVALAKQVLSWITCAKRPLTIVELQNALAVEEGDSKLDKENLPDIEDMVSVCAGLVTIDEESGIIRLVHYTAQEYFERTQKVWFPDVEKVIATICVTYLSFEVFESGFCVTDEAFETRLRLNPFYEYATQNWGHHSHAALLGQELLILGFLKSETKVSSSSQAMMASRRYLGDSRYSQKVPRRMTGVHLAAYFGLTEAIINLLRSGHNSNIRDSYGRTPLSWAAKNGHDAVVELLFDKESVDLDSSNYQAPLSQAAKNGHEGVVKLLLEKGVEPDSSYGRTPLSWAAANGHEMVVRLLLTEGVDPDSKDGYGQTPMSYATANGHEGIVKLLLEKRTDVAAENKLIRTPLHRAALSGDKRMVQRLLKEEADINTKDKSENTALHLAAENGHEAVVRLLLENGADPAVKDSPGETALHRAAEYGHEAVVRLLLERGADVSPRNILGRTPLHWASQSGHEMMVRLLFEEGADVNETGGRGGTALHWASENGREAVVRLLLEFGADVAARNNSGKTALHWAAEKGHEAVVRLLLEKGADPAAKDIFEVNALDQAAENRHELVRSLLLEAVACLTL